MSERPQNKHLKPFKAGTDDRREGNGRKKGISLITVLRQLMESNAPKAMIDVEYVKTLTSKKKLTYNELLGLRLAYAAMSEGDITAIKEIFDRLEGKAEQAVSQKVTFDTPQQITISKDGQTISLAIKPPDELSAE